MTVREKYFSLSESSRFQNAILALIVLNAITIGIETFNWPEKIEWVYKPLIQ